MDLRPRWPLGGRHESATGVIRSTKKKKVHPDLTVCTREAARSTVEAAESLGLIDILGIGARAAGVADAEGRQEGGDAVGRMEELAGAVMGAEEVGE